MESCPRCNYLTPPKALNCPQCHTPLLPVAAAALSPYNGPQSVFAKSDKKKPLLIGGGALVALVAVLAFVLGTRSGNDAPRDLSPIEAPKVDGWAPFRPPNNSFRAEFPGRPERIEDRNTRGEIFQVKHLDLMFKVSHYPAPEYVPSYEAGKKLQEWFMPLFEREGSTIESSASLVSPAGDQVFDAVVLDAGNRNWFRIGVWKGEVIVVNVTGDVTKPVTAEQQEAWKRFRDSLSQ